MSEVRTRFDLTPEQMPTAWFNLMPDMVAAGMQPLPPLSPQTKEPIGPADLAPLFPESLIMQEVSTDQWIDIPGAVHRHLPAVEAVAAVPRDAAGASAPDPRAHLLQVRGRARPAGSHKPNTAVPQAYYNKEAGIRRIATETGAGQWGSAMAMACNFFGLECDVYMVQASYDQKPYRRIFMETFGAGVVASPVGPDEQRSRDPRPASRTPRARSASRSARPWRTPPPTTTRTTRSGSVLGHVLLHQTVIGLEAQQQMEMAGRGARRDRRVRRRRLELSRASRYPFMADKLRGDADDAVRGHRAGGLPHADEGPVRVRLRRHRADRTDRADVHAGPRLRAGAGACGRSALPRRRARPVDARPRGPHGGEGLLAEPDLRGGRAVRDARRASSRRPSRATRSRARSTRPSPRVRRARRG